MVFKIGIWNAWTFMSVFLLQMLVMMFVDKRIWEKSHIPMEAKRNRVEKNIGLIANLVWLLAMIYSVFLPLKLGTIYFYIGFSVFIIGLIIMTMATYTFIMTPADQIIMKGIYEYSRHPMYLSTFIICLGSGIATNSWLFLFLSIIIAICFHKEALLEERFCLEKYDSVYQEYMGRVPRWFYHF